jgi:hypothetical protein
MCAKANLPTLALRQLLRVAQPRQEAPAILADPGRDIFTALTADSEWQMEVADGGEQPIFRLGFWQNRRIKRERYGGLRNRPRAG